ncbi:MAG: hypothetical protein M3Z98_03980 [Candidatus Dormibacteraeota bacterium]|nr:hypothetical protein [Candidatus Dormibacteraeota bacterium]
MATDWGEEQPKISRRLLGRVFCYFVPYWRQAIVVLACIAAGAGLGLVPALVTKGLIDYLAHPRGGLQPLALIVGAGVAAAILGGLIGMAQSYLSTSISEGIMYDLREQQSIVVRLRPRPWRSSSHSRTRDSSRTWRLGASSGASNACFPASPRSRLWSTSSRSGGSTRGLPIAPAGPLRSPGGGAAVFEKGSCFGVFPNTSDISLRLS